MAALALWGHPVCISYEIFTTLNQEDLENEPQLSQEVPGHQLV